MEMQLLYVFNLFSFVGVVGVLFYLIVAKSREDELKDTVEILESKVTSLQNYVYECEERLTVNASSSQDELKEKIIELYKDGKDLMVIENALGVPRAKIEMVLKFHKLKEER
jgi:hypothetical protein